MVNSEITAVGYYVCLCNFFLLIQIFQCHLSVIIGQKRICIFSSEVKKSCKESLCPSLRSCNYYLSYERLIIMPAQN